MYKEKMADEGLTSSARARARSEAFLPYVQHEG